jgi:hypothetical protein
MVLFSFYRDFEFPMPIAAFAAGGTAESVRSATSLGKYQSCSFLFPEKNLERAG